jgi:predicted PurR-regulated permease PerM
MVFTLDKFYQHNRRILSWVIFFALLYILRDFFGLVFLTFVLAFIAAPIVRFFHVRLRLPRRLAIVVCFFLFLGALIAFAAFVVPQVVRETNNLVGNLDDLQTRVIQGKNALAEQYPSLGGALTSLLRSAVKDSPVPPVAGTASRLDPLSGAPAVAPPPQPPASDEELLRLYLRQKGDLLRRHVPRILNALAQGSFTMMLALLFSFLITLDTTRLSKELETLKLSRLRDIYLETAQPLVRLGWVVGRSLQAQAAIACVNTVLTLIGLVVLGIPSLAMLSVVVFVCSFIPVLGVFLSTTPILMVAINADGLHAAALAIALVVVIHLIEAYLLNPLIYGHHLRLNPVLVLMILFVGHHLFGIWGMLLGVPIAFYFIHDVFGVPLWEPKAPVEPPPPPNEYVELP